MYTVCTAYYVVKDGSLFAHPVLVVWSRMGGEAHAHVDAHAHIYARKHTRQYPLLMSHSSHVDPPQHHQRHDHHLRGFSTES